MISFTPSDIPHPKMHQYLLGAIAPRPIALASTMDADGKPNLSPFSFFNVFGVNPTTLIFSPSRRGRDNTTKDTFENVKELPEVVINMVTYDMVSQVSLSSVEFPKGTDEFVKAGFGKVPSDLVRPYRVKESPVHIECRVRQIIETGTGGGAANLVICEILKLHISEQVLDPDGMIDQDKIRLVGRMGRNWYCKAFGEGIFEVEKPLRKAGIGIDSLPENIRQSKVLTGNDLGKLGNLDHMPGQDELDEFRAAFESGDHPLGAGIPTGTNARHALAKEMLQKGMAAEALKLLLI